MPKLLHNLEAISLLYNQSAEETAGPARFAHSEEEFRALAQVKLAVEQIADSPCYINLDMSKALNYSKSYAKRG